MIGVFGGSFDPIHLGHLCSVKEVMQTLSLDELRIVPSNVPPHRNAPVATAEQRSRLIASALISYPGMRLERCEIKRNGFSYTLDTLLTIGKDAGKSLCLIIGQDAFNGFSRWHRWQEILELAHLVVMTRPGCQAWQDENIPDFLNERMVSKSHSLHESKGGKIFCCRVSALDISSSQIRKRLREGEECRHLMPESVLKLINKEKIYN